jgi:hypothetical protein
VSVIPGFYEQAELNAPGAWDATEQGAAQLSSTGLKNANHLPYKQAIAVQERASSHLIIANGNTTSDGNSIKILDRAKGRKFVIIRCPSNQSVGIYIQQRDESNVTGIGGDIPDPEGWYMAPTDPPLYLETEAELWVCTATNGTASAWQLIIGIATEEYKE